MTEKTIKICGKNVKILYCAATENGFEVMSKKSIYDINFTNQNDLFHLSLAAIIAAYEAAEPNKEGQRPEPPVTTKDLMYEAKPADLISLFTSVLELRNKWYEVPEVVSSPETASGGESLEESEQQKN